MTEQGRSLDTHKKCLLQSEKQFKFHVVAVVSFFKSLILLVLLVIGICASPAFQQKNGFIIQELYLNVPSFDLHIQKYMSEIIARVSKFDTYKFTPTLFAN